METDVDKIVTVGEVTRTDNGFVFTYSEEKEGVISSVRGSYSEGVLDIFRKNSEAFTHIRLENGKTHPVKYKTAYGLIPMSARCNEFLVAYLDEKIVIKARYDLMQNEEIVAKNYIKARLEELDE